MKNNSGYFDDALSLIRDDPDSIRASLLFTALRTAHFYRIVPFIAESGMQNLGVEGRRELEKIKKFLRFPQVERNALKHELADSFKEAMEMVMGIRYEEV